MKEIKFRAWDEHNEEWVYETIEGICQAVYFNDTSALNLPNSSCDDEIPEIFCQFTGLKDKNGKEIYEGDIVKHRPTFPELNGKEHIGEVIIEPSRGVCIVNIPICFEAEVIGNIYENPEFLKGASQ